MKTLGVCIPYFTPAAAPAFDADQMLAAKQAHHACMRIQVDCRDGDEPRAFYLGTQRLHIARTLERRTENSARRFRVRVEDGRVFELTRDAAGEWRLASVGGFRQAKAAPSASDFRAR